MMSIDIPDRELASQPTQDQRLHDGRHSKDYYVDADILNRHLDSIEIEDAARQETEYPADETGEG